MSKTVISTDKAPKAIGPYSQAIEVDGIIFCSGQIAIDPSTGKLIDGDISQQTKQVMENIKAILEAAGLSLKNVIKSTIYLTDISQFSIVNQIYGSYFKEEPPARVTVEVKGLPLGALIEIECIARRF